MSPCCDYVILMPRGVGALVLSLDCMAPSYGHLPAVNILQFTVWPACQRWLTALKLTSLFLLTLLSHFLSTEQMVLWLSAKAVLWAEKYLSGLCCRVHCSTPANVGL